MVEGYYQRCFMRTRVREFESASLKCTYDEMYILILFNTINTTTNNTPKYLVPGVQYQVCSTRYSGTSTWYI